MSDAQKYPFLKALSGNMRNVALDNDMLRGRALPCHVVSVQGQIVTIQFDMLPGEIAYPQITIPIATFAYIRYPVQVGDKGVTVPADVSLRGQSGLGTGIANMSLVPSMTALYFLPLANCGWSEEDPDKLVLYGPDGAILKTEDGSSSITIEPGKITAKSNEINLEGNKDVRIIAPDIYLTGIIHLNGAIVQDKDEMTDTTASLIGPLNVQNDATANGVSLSGHDHNVENVQGGDSTITSEKPNAGVGNENVGTDNGPERQSKMGSSRIGRLWRFLLRMGNDADPDA